MKYKVGDKVRVRTWEDMEKEFGLIKNGSIKCDYCFNKMMKKYCGKIVTIRNVYGYCYSVSEDDGCWNWSDDMFEDISKTNKPTNKFFFKKDKTIYYDKDGKRYCVKCCEDDVYDKKVGMLYVLAKAQGIDLRELEELIKEKPKKKDIDIGDIFIVHTPFNSYGIEYSKGDRVLIKSSYLADSFVIATGNWCNLIVNKYDLLKNAYKE